MGTVFSPPVYQNGFLKVGVWNRFIGFWEKCGWVFHSPASGSPPVRRIAVPAGYSPLSAAHNGAGQPPRRWDSTDKSVRSHPPTHSVRDNSVRRRIKAYRTFASLDRGLNVGLQKRKFGSRVKLNAFSG